MGSVSRLGMGGPSDNALFQGDEALIDQMLLEKMNLLVDCTHQRLVPAHPEGPIDKLR